MNYEGTITIYLPPGMVDPWMNPGEGDAERDELRAKLAAAAIRIVLRECPAAEAVTIRRETRYDDPYGSPGMFTLTRTSTGDTRLEDDLDNAIISEIADGNWFADDAE